MRISDWSSDVCSSDLLLIGQLAVDRRHQGRGIGSMLVADAFRRCIAGAEIIGGRAIVVRAIDVEAEAYWQSWGFVAARDNPSILMLSVADISAALLISHCRRRGITSPYACLHPTGPQMEKTEKQ